jgi:hypothetical protein
MCKVSRFGLGFTTSSGICICIAGSSDLGYTICRRKAQDWNPQSLTPVDWRSGLWHIATCFPLCHPPTPRAPRASPTRSSGSEREKLGPVGRRARGLAQVQVARMLPIGLGGLQSGFSTLRYVRSTKGLSQKKSGPRPPRPPPVAPRSWVP